MKSPLFYRTLWLCDKLKWSNSMHPISFGLLTCRNPGTSPTAVPSDRIQMISGDGFPRAVHSMTEPVVLEKSTLLGGSLMNIGPTVVSSHQPGNKKS